MTKTNATRLLAKAGITYSLIEYDVDENDLSASAVSAKTGFPIGALFKTLVLRESKGGIFVCVIPGDDELDLKKAARAKGVKSASMTAVKELLPLTGYIRGGCSPVGMKKNYPVFVDQKAKSFDEICISAGKRGIQIKLHPADLVAFVRAEVADLVL